VCEHSARFGASGCNVAKPRQIAVKNGDSSGFTSSVTSVYTALLSAHPLLPAAMCPGVESDEVDEVCLRDDPQSLPQGEPVVVWPGGSDSEDEVQLCRDPVLVRSHVAHVPLHRTRWQMPF
jgi:hypothetical protein